MDPASHLEINQKWRFFRKVNNLKGVFSVRSPKYMAKCHHSDWDFNETQYTGLFHPNNKVVNVKILNFEKFSRYAPLNSDQNFSIFAITFLKIIEKLHVYSDITSETYALSCG